MCARRAVDARKSLERSPLWILSGQQPLREVLDDGRRMMFGKALHGQTGFGRPDACQRIERLFPLDHIAWPTLDQISQWLDCWRVSQPPQPDHRTHARLGFGMSQGMNQSFFVGGLNQIIDNNRMAGWTHRTFGRQFDEAVGTKKRGHFTSRDNALNTLEQECLAPKYGIV